MLSSSTNDANFELAAILERTVREIVSACDKSVFAPADRPVQPNHAGALPGADRSAGRRREDRGPDEAEPRGDPAALGEPPPGALGHQPPLQQLPERHQRLGDLHVPAQVDRVAGERRVHGGAHGAAPRLPSRDHAPAGRQTRLQELRHAQRRRQRRLQTQFGLRRQLVQQPPGARQARGRHRGPRGHRGNQGGEK